MSCKNHVRVNFCILLWFFTIWSMMMRSDFVIIRRFGSYLVSLLIPNYVSSGFSGGIMHEWSAWCFCMSLFFMVGSILPDVMVRSPVVCLFFRHVFRLKGLSIYYTHNIVFIFVCYLVSFCHPYLFALFLGYLLHVLIDSVSEDGLCLFYGLRSYVCVKDKPVLSHHRICLYQIGARSESMFVFVLMSFCICFVVYFGIMQDGLAAAYQYMLR